MLSAANLVTSGRQATMLTHRPLGVRLAARQPLLPSSRRGGTLPRKLETVVSATGPPGLNVSGPVYTPDDRDYASKRNQYAYSSYADEGGMNPAAIIYAKDDVDVKRVIEYAAERKLAIAVRTGGHQYSGASSTALGNIQLDLSDTYKDFGYDEPTSIVTTGISYRLSELNSKLGELGVFVPHGQCAYVNVGGHAHTGGYGLPGRAFGLFGDHIVAVRVFTADGNVRWIERNSTEPADADLFWAILGGSPGNFAILTHIKLKVHRDEDHPKACGLSLYAPYSKAALTRLLQIKAEMADDVNLPADYDMCITVMSADKPVQGSLRTSAPILMALKDDDGGERLGSEPEERPDITTVLEKYGVPQDDIEALRQQMPKPKRAVPPEEPVVLMAFGDDMKKIDVPDGAAVIIVWAEWANLGGAKQDYDPSWFQRIKDAANFLPFVSQEFTNAKMSFLTSKWVFPIQREFDGPYNKRTYATSSTSLTKSGWVSFTADQIHSIVSPWEWAKGARVAVQIQNYGGDLSTYRLNDPTDKTSYSWRRDTTVVLTMDCFYVKDIFGGLIGKETADAWVASNDAGLKGPNGKFSPNEDRRLLWGSYHATIGEKNLYNARLFYHETEEKWARLAAIKRRVDPNNILSPNEFAVKA